MIKKDKIRVYLQIISYIKVCVRVNIMIYTKWNIYKYVWQKYNQSIKLEGTYL